MRDRLNAHPQPSIGTVVALQWRHVALSHRWLLVVVGAFAFLAAWSVPDFVAVPGSLTMSVLTIHIFGVLIAAAWAASVWRGEEPSRRAYFNSLPVNGFTHRLIRVGVGLVWAYTGLALTLGLGTLLIYAYGHDPLPLWSWQLLFIGSTIAYLLTAALAVGFDRPGHWLVGIWLGLLMIGIADERWDVPGAEAVLSIVNGRWGFVAGIGGEFFTMPVVGNPEGPPPEVLESFTRAGLLWLGIAVAAVLVAAYLRREA